MDLDRLLMWQGQATQLFALGVRSFQIIRAAMQSAGEDEALIAALEPKWDALHADVQRAAGG